MSFLDDLQVKLNTANRAAEVEMGLAVQVPREVSDLDVDTLVDAAVLKYTLQVGEGGGPAEEEVYRTLFNLTEEDADAFFSSEQRLTLAEYVLWVCGVLQYEEDEDAIVASIASDAREDVLQYAAVLLPAVQLAMTSHIPVDEAVSRLEEPEGQVRRDLLAKWNRAAETAAPPPWPTVEA